MAIQAQAAGEGDRGSPPLAEPPEVNPDVSLPLPLPQSNLPIGERLGRFVRSWEKITEHQWVLPVIKRGNRIPFISKPLSPTLIFFLQSNISVLEEEVQLLLTYKTGRTGVLLSDFSGPEEKQEIKVHNRFQRWGQLLRKVIN